ncbi:AraC-like DNA-binding protein [Arcicella aurantiaca]|uniref:AraC-like DNA-binding protein n=1 Tax=Arcicella aurantiaca TaxID=591202 RepID=A0A316EGU8_9BACT|nr:helix-turn-helix domain-containing protein [Arcicella aurantiaca]PWK27967.1 AraC-like DNA-binding protein [Arcicella aurantiaca]
MPITYPLKIDIFACLMFLGIVQALFLAYFFIFGKRGNRQANRFLGILLLGFVLAMTEILLCYTNLMFQMVWLIDFAEPTNFLFAPLVYLYVRATLNKPFQQKDWLHFVPFFLYLIYKSIAFTPLGYPEKYNAYIGSYYPELPHLPTSAGTWSNAIYCISDYTNELFLVSMLVYSTANIWLLLNVFREQNLPFFSNQNNSLKWARQTSFWFISVMVIFVIFKKSFPHDLGDHLIAAHLTLIIYLISVNVIRNSVFFTHENKEIKKYEKSSLTSEIQENTLAKINHLMENEKPFLSDSFSMPALAKQLSVSPHHLSQILNESLGQTFFDFTAQHRIQEAQKLLLENPNLKIEEIAERVGYNSKSAFNTAFKKFTGVSPSQFRKS